MKAVLDASVRIGELMQAVPKQKNNNPNGNNQHKGGQNDSDVASTKTKTEVIKDAGFTPKQVERFQQMAANPELVEQVKAEAKENGRFDGGARGDNLPPLAIIIGYIVRDVCGI